MRPRLPFRPIVGGFLLAAAVVIALTAWLLAGQLNFDALLAFLAAINLATFAAYLYDKSVKRPFRAWFWSIVLLQIAALSLWIWCSRRH